MKLADALDALADCDGLRVHRSWWVARHAVEQARWRRGRGELELRGGLVAPVSNRHAAEVKRLDWA
jgi:DNA-binding LytR/AlgR family response regulator